MTLRLAKKLAHNAEPVLPETMKSAAPYRLVLVTAPDLKTARSLARTALNARLIACANLVPGVESLYWWQHKIERGKEILLVLKTPARCLDRLEKLLLAKHPYDTPEFLVLKLDAGNARYLNWLAIATKRPGKGIRH